MAIKHKLHHYLTLIRKLNLWILISVTIVFGMISVLALRQNNLRFLELKSALVTADQNGGDVETALRELRAFMVNHMNTSLHAGSNTIESEKPIQLKTQFEKDLTLTETNIKAINSTKLLNDATAKCERPELSVPARAECVAKYISSIESSNSPVKDLYTFDFIAPWWTPDLAGFSLVITCCLAFLLFVRVIVTKLLGLLLKHKHYGV